MKTIFIGTTDIAFQINDFKSGFEKLGYKVITASNFNVKDQGLTYNFSFISDNDKKKNTRYNPFKKIKNRFELCKYYQRLLKYAVNHCDYFLFIWSSIKPDFSDYKILKEKKKKIATFFVGDDIRWYNSMEQEFYLNNMRSAEYSDSKHTMKELKQKVTYLRTSERYSDLILSVPNQSQLALRSYQIAFVPININVFTENNLQRKVPEIIHVPSYSLAKGTKYIIPVIERLKSEGVGFNFTLLENIPYKEIGKYYSNADILIEQMLIPGGGKQSREALACGTIVVSHMNYNYNNYLSEACPIIDANPENLYNVLKKLILNTNLRIDIAKKGRPWVEKYHSTTEVCRNIINLMEKENPDSAINPNFFRKQYIPKNKKEAQVLNKFTLMVTECEWYRKHIAAGERDGLRF